MYAGSVVKKPKSVISVSVEKERARAVNAVGTFCAAMRMVPKPGFVGVAADAERLITTSSSSDMP